MLSLDGLPNMELIAMDSSTSTIIGYSEEDHFNSSIVRPSQNVVQLDCSKAFILPSSLLENKPYSGTLNIHYQSSEAGFYNGEVVASTGVTGLAATLAAGSFSNGSGVAVYTLFGIPNSAGIAKFDISFGGQSCTLELKVDSPSPFELQSFNQATIH